MQSRARLVFRAVERQMTVWLNIIKIIQLKFKIKKKEVWRSNI